MYNLYPAQKSAKRPVKSLVQTPSGPAYDSGWQIRPVLGAKSWTLLTADPPTVPSPRRWWIRWLPATKVISRSETQLAILISIQMKPEGTSLVARAVALQGPVFVRRFWRDWGPRGACASCCLVLLERRSWFQHRRPPQYRWIPTWLDLCLKH